ncbi:threonine-phosphate decarboxylase CobD [Tumidithrix elongata RA019]|uniref:threonine-phosphate decarboxylase n=1 Tax=Tumidithrix elongata BACA0141 TaxID=2716417 RepID=A0AAW9Q1M5_9CYAN|nr:threonine-phosphate decarboxylase CobD [Tumidithrix elongata RA019]
MSTPIFIAGLDKPQICYGEAQSNCPPSPQFWGNKNFQSFPELGDLGGKPFGWKRIVFGIPMENLAQPSHGGNLRWAAQISQRDPSQILDFSASISPLGCPKSVLERLKSDETLNTISRYPDPSYTLLREAIAAHHHISPDYILVGNGAAELLTWLCRDLARFASVFLGVPAFGDYLRGLKAFNAQIIPIDWWQRGDRALALQTLNRALNQTLNSVGTTGNSRSRGILLNNPHNPTGQLYTREELLPLLEQFELVAIDEAFMDFLPPETSQSLIDRVESSPNLVILRSLTKFYSMPGLRIGYAIAHPQRLQTWQAWRDPWSVNCLAEIAAIACLQDREFQQKTWDWLAKERSHLYADLSNIVGLHPIAGAANFLLVESERSVLALQEHLLKQDGILIRDCHSFAELGDRYFRVCVKLPADRERLIKGIEGFMEG